MPRTDRGVAVAIVGAGLLGASLAWRLAERGVRVTLLDATQPGCGTSGTSFAWLNANNKQPRAYFDLNVAGMEAHRQFVASEPTADWAHFTGHLQWAASETDAAVLAEKADRLRSWGYRVDEIDPASARALEPDLVLDDVRGPLFLFPDEGFAYPRVLLGQLLRNAVAAGVECHFDQKVTEIRSAASGRRQIVLAAGSIIEADIVALATGRWTEEVARRAGAEVPLIAFSTGAKSVGYLAYTAPLTARIRRVISAPGLNLRPDGGGRLVLQALDLDDTASPDVTPGPASPIGEAFLGRLAARLRGAERTRLDDLRVGMRPIPRDGIPAVGWIDGSASLYVVVTHSGVTLGLYLGALAAAEIATGAAVPELAPFRPTRFQAHA